METTGNVHGSNSKFQLPQVGKLFNVTFNSCCPYVKRVFLKLVKSRGSWSIIHTWLIDATVEELIYLFQIMELLPKVIRITAQVLGTDQITVGMWSLHLNVFCIVSSVVILFCLDILLLPSLSGIEIICYCTGATVARYQMKVASLVSYWFSPLTACDLVYQST